MNDVGPYARALRERLSTMSPVQRTALAFAAPQVADAHTLVVGLLGGIEDLADRVLLLERTNAELLAREAAAHRRLASLERSRSAALSARGAGVEDAEILDAGGLQLVDAARRLR